VVDFTVKQLALINSPSTYRVKARFFRGTTQQQTFAVLQWYATPTMGNISPWRWFIADQIAQWRQQRVPWVAVSILILMEPLAETQQYWKLAQSFGETVQAELSKAAF
jgi:cyanoexosortase B-associated protein